MDLNLIKLFSVLYKTGSVKETADSLNLSQSACSHALQRLRERMKDDLFVRVGNKMLPTEYANSIADQLIEGISMIEKGIKPTSSFNPSEPYTFKIAVTDYTSWCMHHFICQLSRDFPNISIELVHIEERLPEVALREGEFDLVCGFSHQIENYESFDSKVWFEDEYVCVHRQNHPYQDNTELAEFLRHKHVLVTPWNESKGILDVTLAKLRKKRKIAVKTPSVLSAPTFVIDTPYLLATPKRYANYIVDYMPVSISPLPLEVPLYIVKLYWHKTRNSDPKIQWISQKITES